MNKHQLTVLISSLAVWTYIVHMYVLLFILLAIVMILMERFLFVKKPILAITLNTMLFVSGFFLLKNAFWNEIVLPVGYSVFAFSAIAYMIDQKRECKYYSLIEKLNFLFFFPKAFAGPIERAGQLIPQMRNPLSVGKDDAYQIFKLCVFASFCKFVVADTLCRYDPLDYYGVNSLISVFLFAISFYFDFYAYSLFAIAFGKVFGIQLSDSFYKPYRSRTLKDFWSRWNITLGTWLRDYVYIPLGGSRSGTLVTFLSLMIVFLVSAVWHSTTWPFILWGAVPGISLFIEKYFKIKGNVSYSFWIVFLTCFLWQCFKVESLSELADTIIHCTQWGSVNLKLLVLFALGIFITVLTDSKRIRKLIFTHPDQRSEIKVEVALISLMLTMVLIYPHSVNINFFYLRF